MHERRLLVGRHPVADEDGSPGATERYRNVVVGVGVGDVAEGGETNPVDDASQNSAMVWRSRDDVASHSRGAHVE